MKLSTRKIIGIEVGATLLWAAMLLIPSTIVREYAQLGVLGLALLVSWWLLGWAHVRARDGRVAMVIVILSALVFQVVTFVLLGLKLGFVRNVYRWNWESLVKISLPAINMIVLVEILRGQMIMRGHQSKVAIIVTTLTCVALEMIWTLPIYNLTIAKDGFDLAMLVVVPSLLRGCLLSYIAYEYDYRTNIVYRLIMELPVLMLPILPNVNEYLSTMFSIVLIVVMACIMVRIHGTSGRSGDVKTRPVGESQIHWKRVAKYGAVVVLGAGILIYVGLMSGIFKYHLLAIGSGSMEPNIMTGDMVLVEKTHQYETIEEGEVLVYRKDDVVMVHRLTGREELNGQYYFKTKGDANESEDKWVVDQGDVIGVARGRMIALGYPTLWLNEMFNGGKN